MKRILTSELLLLGFICITLQFVPCRTEGNTDQDDEAAYRLISGMAQSRQGLAALKKVIHDIDSDLIKTHSRIQELENKRRGLHILEKILEEMDADLMLEQKRSCRVNLGGHCATESAAAVADHWHYLNSPLSPGRKRRDTRLYKKLINGKLFQ